jgi:hypothetical protein
MWRFYAVIGLVWLALMPPFFTDGACTAQFEGEAARVQANTAALSTPQSAVQYWQDRAVAPTVIPEEQCRKVKPRFLADCGNGPLIYVRVPVENRICRLYRDDEVKIQIQYDERNHPVRIAVDMDPFKSIPLPFIGVTLHWAR